MDSRCTAHVVVQCVLSYGVLSFKSHEPLSNHRRIQAVEAPSPNPSAWGVVPIGFYPILKNLGPDVLRQPPRKFASEPPMNTHLFTLSYEQEVDALPCPSIPGCGTPFGCLGGPLLLCG